MSGSRPKTPVRVEEPCPFDVQQAFETLWEECLRDRVPRPVKKTRAKAHYVATVKSATDADACATARRRYLTSRAVQDGNVEEAGTWFGHWRSLLPPVPKAEGKLSPMELRVLVSLLMRMGMVGSNIAQLLIRHGITEQEIRDADPFGLETMFEG